MAGKVDSPFDEAKYKALLEGLEAVELLKSEVLIDNDTFRFDSEFFKKEYLENEKILEQIKNTRIKDIFYPIKNGVDFRDYENKGSTYYIRTADIKENGFQETAVKINFKEQIPQNLQLRENDILFTRKGNYGKNCLVDEKIKKL